MKLMKYLRNKLMVGNWLFPSVKTEVIKQYSLTSVPDFEAIPTPTNSMYLKSWRVAQTIKEIWADFAVRKQTKGIHPVAETANLNVVDFSKSSLVIQNKSTLPVRWNCSSLNRSKSQEHSSNKCNVDKTWFPTRRNHIMPCVVTSYQMKLKYLNKILVTFIAKFSYSLPL